MRSVPRRRPALRTVSAATAAAVVLAVAAPAYATPATPASPTPTPPSAAVTLTAGQALAQARSTGKAVAVDGATTPTDTLTANPNGTLTLTRSVLPTRKRTASGAWATLDATLNRNSDGSITPAVTTSALTLSGGGAGPLATMQNRGKSLAISLPMTLPTPTLAGATATYAQVLPGVDLQVTADTQGGFSEVLAVHDATAATNPALKTLSLATKATGVSVSADTAGNITADDHGRAIFTAPTPRMWDSATTTSPTTTQQAATSSAAGPGGTAHTAPIGVATTSGAINLTPDQAFLTAPNTVYPVYIDPSWTPVGATNNGWASVARRDGYPSYAATKYWGLTPAPDGRMQVGYETDDNITARTLVNFPIPLNTLYGATINSAVFNITETHSWSCTASRLNLYAPADVLTPGNATWNYWANSLGGVISWGDLAYGYSTSCPAHGIGFDVTGTIRNAVNIWKSTQTFALAAGNESDSNGWKKFLATSPTLSITYNHAPNTPTGMTTSPATECGANPPSPVGDGQVSLYTPVSDPDGGSLDVTYQLWKTSDTTKANLIPAGPLTSSSGTTAVRNVPEATLMTNADKDANGKAVITAFSWQAGVNDGIAPQAWSATCTFNFDPTRTGAPTVTPPGSTTIGTAFLYTIKPPATGTLPDSYIYQLNAAPPQTVNAKADGSVDVTITPTRFTNTLAVTSRSVGKNLGDTATVIFNSNPAATAADQDMTGDGHADLLTVGAQNGLPAGLWLGAKNTPGVGTTGVNIGANGNGVAGDNSPADFTGAQAITGHFTGSGLQDVLVYYPTGTNAGGGMVLNGNGDGSVIQAQLSGNEHTLSAGALLDINNANPLQVANAGNAAGQNLAYPDLITVNGDPTNGYYLAYYPNQNGTNNYQFPVALDPTTYPTPTGGTDWNTWTITTCQHTDGSTAMFLWNKTTGALFLWNKLAFNLNTWALTYTQYSLSSTWNQGANLALQAADINGDGTPDLWTVGANGATTAHLVSGLTGTTATITAHTPQTLITSDHTWPLSGAYDSTTNKVITSGPITTATDTTGGSNLARPSNSGNANWHTGDLYSPDAQLNIDSTGAIDAAPTGMLVGSGPNGKAIIDTNNSFTVSAWVKPINEAGVIASEDGAHSARFILWGNNPDKTWRFALATSDTTSWAYNGIAASAGSIQLGVWTHLQAVYDAPAGVMYLYVNDTLAATGKHTTTVTWPATGNIVLGSYLYNDTHQQYYAGQISNVQTWNSALKPDVLTTVSLLANANSKYVTADGAGDYPLIANRTTSGPWEQFDEVDTGDGYIALRAHANGKYVTADNAGTQPLIANRTAIGAWEKFKIINNSDGSISLLANANGQYVTAESGGGSPLIANRTTIGPWEKFFIR
ncbi:LamG-like jellyroll fold domain-containing protein [Planosporangium mesophilum]|uniref:LamG-like jellyroll fold domain-containing protein n=1 Tax=Planosporangium mesophilum TaxID=689768 RepID=A0A8J3TJI3_9ACTN|nr:LamG-like jellyroll fold domain-containing protein [Planosporangium mesophilum]NJC83118.1 hypothetical protein [Planosporangium mesophilum]GII22530.1 hypothetical protein Pme01_21270 [Planosporangium mesophilum]